MFVPGAGTYECKAKGVFRKDNVKPMVGDNVEIDVLDEDAMEGNLKSIYERKNELVRPLVANIDQALVIFAMKNPTPNLNLLDRFLISMEMQDVSVVICFNKRDIVTVDEMDEFRRIYDKTPYKLVFTSTKSGEGMDELKKALCGKVSAVAGPSGVGKSSVIKAINPDADVETGEISRKLARGKHTTRHSEIIRIDDDTFIMDTPGFSSLYVDIDKKEDLKLYFPEFRPYEEKCRFSGCAHVSEPDCAVKEAVEAGDISKERYESYLMLYDEIRSKRRY